MSIGLQMTGAVAGLSVTQSSLGAYVSHVTTGLPLILLRHFSWSLATAGEVCKNWYRPMVLFETDQLAPVPLRSHAKQAGLPAQSIPDTA